METLFVWNQYFAPKMDARSLNVHCNRSLLQFVVFAAFKLKNPLLMLYQDYSNIEFGQLLGNFSKNPPTQ